MLKEKEVKICLGLNEENQIVFSNLRFSKDHYAITHDTLGELITEEEGKQRARESLEEGEFWRQAVEDKQTTDSLEDWVEQVLNIDGWESTLDASYFGEYQDEIYYSLWDSCGASIEDFKSKFKVLLIPQVDVDLIIESDKLHIKDFKKHNKKDKELLKKLKALSKKYEDQKGYEETIIKAYLENKD